MDDHIEFVFLYHPHTYDMDPGAQVGLGMLLLATYAKKLGASVKVINAQSKTIEEACEAVPNCDFLMMYGCMVDQHIVEDIALRIEAEKKARYICLGGPIAYGHYIKVKGINYIVDGYGEDFIYAMLEPSNIATFNPAELRHNINYYPFPDRSLLKGKYGGKIFKGDGLTYDVSTTLLTSRGCKFNCAFCFSGDNSFFEEYSIERLGAELESCTRLGIYNIRISDDNLVANTDRLHALCSLFKDAGIRWRGSIRVVPNDLYLYEMMKDSGCEELSFGIESGDQKVLNLLNKGATVTQNTKAIVNAKRAGILTRALMMMGTPGETKNTIHHNMSWIEAARPDVVSLKMFVPYPGTAIYHSPKVYNCNIHLPIIDANNSAYRPDHSQPKAHIDSERMYQEELTAAFAQMKNYLEMKGIANHG